MARQMEFFATVDFNHGIFYAKTLQRRGLLGRKVAADVKRQAGQEEVGPDLSRYR